MKFFFLVAYLFCFYLSADSLILKSAKIDDDIVLESSIIKVNKNQKQIAVGIASQPQYGWYKLKRVNKSTGKETPLWVNRTVDPIYTWKGLKYVNTISSFILPPAYTSEKTDFIVCNSNVCYVVDIRWRVFEDYSVGIEVAIAQLNIAENHVFDEDAIYALYRKKAELVAKLAERKLPGGNLPGGDKYALPKEIVALKKTLNEKLHIVASNRYLSCKSNYLQKYSDNIANLLPKSLQLELVDSDKIKIIVNSRPPSPSSLTSNDFVKNLYEFAENAKCYSIEYDASANKLGDIKIAADKPGVPNNKDDGYEKTVEKK